MKKIRYSEMFTSFQGEAEFTGMPSVWLRFFGCNLQCNGFGQENPTKPSTYDLPYKTIDLKSFTRMEDLPILDKGCDSGYSWSAKFKHLAQTDTILHIADNIRKLAREELGLVEGSWFHPQTCQPVQMCFTGGEPMLYQQAMLDILETLYEFNDCNPLPQITIETNGTKPLDLDIFQKIRILVHRVHFAISPKLFSVSGEKNAVKLDVIESYAKIADSLSVKFVINGTKESWEEIESYRNKLVGKIGFRAKFWVMPVGATIESQRDPKIAEIAREAMKLGYNVSARVHCYVFGNKMST